MILSLFKGQLCFKEMHMSPNLFKDMHMGPNLRRVGLMMFNFMCQLDRLIKCLDI